jgi:hypothetical protein
MIEGSYSENVKSLTTFWKSLKSWVKKVIFWTGFFLGVSIWVTLNAGIFPIVALILLGSGTPALVMQVLAGMAIVASLVLTVWILVVWLKWLIYLVSWLILSNGNLSLGKIIFEEGDSK